MQPDILRRLSGKTDSVVKPKVGETILLLLDVEEILQKNSPRRLIGKPIMVEHLHPSSYGHYLIAAGLARLIYVNGLLEQEKTVDFHDPAVIASFGVKKFSESFQGNEMWPFTINNKDYSFP